MGSIPIQNVQRTCQERREPQCFEKAYKQEETQVITDDLSTASRMPWRHGSRWLDFLSSGECCIHTIFLRRECNSRAMSLFEQTTAQWPPHAKEQLEFIPRPLVVPCRPALVRGSSMPGPMLCAFSADNVWLMTGGHERPHRHTHRPQTSDRWLSWSRRRYPDML